MWNKVKKHQDTPRPPSPPQPDELDDMDKSLGEDGQDPLDESLGEVLSSMDIDTDYNMWNSFRSDLVSRGSADYGSLLELTEEEEEEEEEEGGEKKDDNETETGKEEDKNTGGKHWGTLKKHIKIKSNVDPQALTEEEVEYINGWKKRVERSDVYQSDYRPVPRETREIRDLAAFLGITPPEGYFERRPGSASRPGTAGHNKPDEDTSNNETQTTVERLLFPTDGNPKSILLKRGPVLLKRDDGTEVERELILLSHGFILAEPSSPSSSFKNHSFKNATTTPEGSTKSLSTDSVTSTEEPSNADANNDTTASTTDSPSAPQPHHKSRKSALGKSPLWHKLSFALHHSKIVRRHFDTAEEITNVSCIDPLHNNGFAIHLVERSPPPPPSSSPPSSPTATDDSNAVQNPTSSHVNLPSSYVFTSPKTKQCTAWINALIHAHTEIQLIKHAEKEAAESARKKQSTLPTFFRKSPTSNNGKSITKNYSTRNAIAGHKSVKSITQDYSTHNAFAERGERLDRLSSRSNALHEGASDYRDAARLLKEKAKMKKEMSVFGKFKSFRIGKSKSRDSK